MPLPSPARREPPAARRHCAVPHTKWADATAQAHRAHHPPLPHARRVVAVTACPCRSPTATPFAGGHAHMDLEETRRERKEEGWNGDICSTGM